jgi:hypothetical protein
MGQVCDLCGEEAGWFKSRHSACVARADALRAILAKTVFDGIIAGKHYMVLEAEVRQASGRIPLDYFREVLLQGANDAAFRIALQAPITHEECNRLASILQGFGINNYAAEFSQRRWFGFPSLYLSCLLWEVLHDVAPVFEDELQFNVRSGEIPIYQCHHNGCQLAEERTITNHARTFGGLSIPIGSGIYYHFGGSQRQEQSGLLPVDVGVMLITSKTIYFGGQKTTLRIPLDQVIRYIPYADGVGVCESCGSPKVFTFGFNGMDTGWFFYNLLTALTHNLLQNKS